MHQLTELKVLVIKCLAKMKFIYKRDKQGLYHINRTLITTLVTLIGLTLGLASYYSWQIKQKRHLTQQIAQLNIKNNSLSQSKIPPSSDGSSKQANNIQSIIGYLTIEGFMVQNISSNQDHDRRIWKAEGVLDQVNLTKFITYIDENKQLLNINGFNIEQIDESPEQLKISLSGTL